MGKKIYGRLMLDLAGTELQPDERKLLANKHVGGVILFSRNIASKQQVCLLVEDIRSCSDSILVAVDQEGGRVQRFKQGFTALPPMQVVGDLVSLNLKPFITPGCILLGTRGKNISRDILFLASFRSFDAFSASTFESLKLRLV